MSTRLLIIAALLCGLAILVAFGIIGIFVGPVVLAVAYTLLDNWVGPAPATTCDTVPSSGQSAQSTPVQKP